MLLRYTGQARMANDLLSTVIIENQSLLSLRNTMASFGYPSQCVTMTLNFLSEITHPCILHTQDQIGNMHYQVCYGKVRTIHGHQFLMADPAKQFYFISQDKLDQLWKSRAALYVDGLTADLSAFGQSPFSLLVKSAQLPGMIWVIMPVLTLINALFGIALSLLLQRGYFSLSLFNSRHIIVALVILLWIISVFKSGFTYLRQIILLKINRRIWEQYFRRLTQKLASANKVKPEPSKEWPTRAFREISLIQNSISLFLTTLLSEGSLVIIAVCAIVYTEPAAGLLLALFIGLQFAIALMSYSGILYKTAVIRQKSASVEGLLSGTLFQHSTVMENVTSLEVEHLAAAEGQAIRLSKNGIVQEISGALVVVMILALTSFRLFSQQIDYPTLMVVVVLSYISVSIIPKLIASYLFL